MKQIFPPLVQAADDVAGALKELGRFKTVRQCALSSYEQLYKLLPGLIGLPAAVVCLGPMNYDDTGAVRRLTIGVIVVDKLRFGADEKSRGVWNLADAVAARFEPEFKADNVKINGNLYCAAGTSPLALGGEHAAILIELAVDMPAAYLEE